MSDSSMPLRQTFPLDTGWQFQLEDTPSLAVWRAVQLPHDWSIEQAPTPDAPAHVGGGYFPTGAGVYSLNMLAPTDWQGKHISIEFEGAAGIVEAWLNDVSLGVHPYPYTPFRIELTPHLRLGSENTLTVRVDNSAQPNSRWYTGSGLYRRVYLHVTNPLHIVPNGVFVSTREASAHVATLGVQITLANPGRDVSNLTVELSVEDERGTVVATGQVVNTRESTLSTEIEVEHPQLWSPDSPTLYHLRVRVVSHEQEHDEVVVPFGIRTIQVSAERGFELNGHTLKLWGGNLHHDHGPLGTATFACAEERRVKMLKAMGFNAVRTSHNPPSTEFLNACDRLGMMVMDEAFDGWAAPKLKHDYSVHFHQWWPRDIESYVKRDRNHPSVVLWSIGNEVFERGQASGHELAAKLAAHVRKFDPTRPVTIGLNNIGPNGDWMQLDPMFAPVDVAGYNYEVARPEADHTRLPARVILNSESYQSDTFDCYQATVKQLYVIGDFVWTVFDYLGEAGLGRVFQGNEATPLPWQGEQFPWHGAPCGDFDLIGQRKPNSHYRQIVWDKGELLYATVQYPAPDGQPWQVLRWSLPPSRSSWTWAGLEGQILPVEVYSRHESVRLFLNGRLLGEAPTGESQKFKAIFEVPYEPGRLEVAGIQNGQEVERFVLQTADEATGLRLQAEHAAISADTQQLAFVHLEVVDAQNRLCPHTNPEITYTLSGPGTIAGVGSADLTDTTSYQSHTRRAFEGRSLIVLRSDGTPGTIELTASVTGWKEARVRIEVKTTALQTQALHTS